MYENTALNIFISAFVRLPLISSDTIVLHIFPNFLTYRTVGALGRFQAKKNKEVYFCSNIIYYQFETIYLLVNYIMI